MNDPSLPVGNPAGSPAVSAAASQDNAMTEVALALAMGFFSLMVLTLVSMGNGSMSNGEPVTYEEPGYQSIAVAWETKAASAGSEASSQDRFVVYTGGEFYDDQGKPVDPAGLSVPPEGRLVLVVAPDESLTEIMRARALLPDGRVIVAEMDQAWSKAVEGWGDKP